MSKIRHAIILAAGRGHRMMPLTDSLPKPMAPYNGSTLIAQGISRIARRVEHVHITVGYKRRCWHSMSSNAEPAQFLALKVRVIPGGSTIR